MLGLARKVFGTGNDRYLKSLQPVVAQINALREEMSAKSDDELRAVTDQLKQRLQDGETLDDVLPTAFAAVREATGRALGTPHYDVQLMGGIVLHQGKISEMKTGEGKTQVAALAAYLNALTGKGVHVVTVNDYLAHRDAEWMGKVYERLGMTCLPITNDLSPDARKESYAADITYATNNELGFDYLRDNMAFDEGQLVQRELNFAIIDEVDSILIDEARTPLIISGPTEDKTDLYRAIDDIMPAFKRDEHFEVDEKLKTATLTDVGMDEAERILKEKGFLEPDASLFDMHSVMLVHHLNQALRAHALFTRDVDYIVKDGEVVIIDEFTGRMMPGRRYSEGLHQALEAREKVSIKSENQTLASITFQNYFRLYNKLSGMTGTADTEAEEFATIYDLGVVILPTNVEVARVDEADLIYRTRAEKERAIAKDIKNCHERGQPVLVGTTSIEKSEQLSELLKKEKVPHNVLNARYHEQEAEIIAQAGRLGAVTIATNMAGRGTDIKLGGNLELLLEEAKDEKDAERIRQTHNEEHAAVMEAGGLRVIGTERHESRRIDNQLRGRSGRQGDVGSSAFYISLEDDLMRIFAAGMEGLMGRLDMPEDEAIQSRLVSRAIETAQRKIESRNFDIRKNLLKYDDVLNDQRKVIYDQRRDLLESEDVSDVIVNFRHEALEVQTAYFFPPQSYPEQWDLDNLAEELRRLFNAAPDVKKMAAEEGVGPEEIHAKLQGHLDNIWSEKENRLGADILRRLEKIILLQVLDNQWKDHLQRLDFLKQGIGLRGYGQKDPLNEFKREAFEMFEQLLGSIRDETVTLLSRVEVNKGDMEAVEREEAALAAKAPQAADPHTGDQDPYTSMNLPRNAPCPCGSGKKYKHCHGKLQAA